MTLTFDLEITLRVNLHLLAYRYQLYLTIYEIWRNHQVQQMKQMNAFQTKNDKNPKSDLEVTLRVNSHLLLISVTVIFFLPVMVYSFPPPYIADCILIWVNKASIRIVAVKVKAPTKFSWSRQAVTQTSTVSWSQGHGTLHCVQLLNGIETVTGERFGYNYIENMWVIPDIYIYFQFYLS